MVNIIVRVVLTVGYFTGIVVSKTGVLSKNIFYSNHIDDATPLSVEDYIRQHGYPVEAHEIETEDGYLLTYHRIPHGKAASGAPPGRPVLLQHGLMCSSAGWVLSDTALGYSLADAGFDVWLGNARGNTYSRKHVKYDPEKDKEAFWNFSWHEMGYYDLPASIDYILNVTGRAQLFYIGHSMGTTMYFVLGSTRPQYMDKVQAAVVLAPVVFPWHIRSPVVNFMDSLHAELKWLSKTFGVYEMFTYSNLIFWLDHNICARLRLQFICRDFIFALTGFDDKELNRTSLPTILEFLPAGASYKTVDHYYQINRKGVNFTQYDYGDIRNLWKYGSVKPPEYNLTNARAPVYVYYSENDWLAVPQDVQRTVKSLPNVQAVTEVSDVKFNHLDFMWAIDAKTLIYDDIISILLKLT